MDADIVCVGFGPATAGFLTTLSKQLVNPDGTPAVESAVMPGMPPQVLVLRTRGRHRLRRLRRRHAGAGVARKFPEIETAGIPMAAPVGEEKVVYLLDPHGASRRSADVAAGGRVHPRLRNSRCRSSITR